MEERGFILIDCLKRLSFISEHDAIYTFLCHRFNDRFGTVSHDAIRKKAHHIGGNRDSQPLELKNGIAVWVSVGLFWLPTS